MIISWANVLQDVMHMHETPIRIDHVGIAVESVDDAESILLALGCERLADDTVDGRFRWVYYRLGNASRLELIEPISDDSFLTRYLDENGPGLHHVTLEVADIETVIEALEANDISVIDYRTFEEWTEAFVSPRNSAGTLFQLMEYHEAYANNRERPAEELFVGGGSLSTWGDE